MARTLSTSAIIDDKLRSKVLEDFEYRISLGAHDEAAIGAYDFLDKLNELARTVSEKNDERRSGQRA
jgi:hypothetical protein